MIQWYVDTMIQYNIEHILLNKKSSLTSLLKFKRQVCYTRTPGVIHWSNDGANLYDRRTALASQTRKGGDHLLQGGGWGGCTHLMRRDQSPDPEQRSWLYARTRFKLQGSTRDAHCTIMIRCIDRIICNDLNCVWFKANRSYCSWRR